MKFPQFKVRQRINDWVQSLVDRAVERQLPDEGKLLNAVVNQISKDDLANLLNTAYLQKAVADLVADAIDLDGIAEKAAESVCASDVASYLDASDVASHIDASDVAAYVELSASDVAGEIDAEDVARYVEVDQDSIAGSLAETISVDRIARHLDYGKLAEALVEKLKEAWAN